MKQINKIIQVTEKFNEYSRQLLNNECSYCVALIKEHSEAETCIEDDGNEYCYPELVTVKFESWSNHWYMYRVSDGRWIPEGVDVNSEGISTFKLMRRLVDELKAYNAHVDEVTSPQPKPPKLAVVEG